MLQRLLLLAFLVGLGWMLRRLFALAAASSRMARRDPPGRRGAGTAAPPTRMVRDRVCNTFVPEATALRTTAGGVEHFFCSERCRARFLASAATAANAGS